MVFSKNPTFNNSKLQFINVKFKAFTPQQLYLILSFMKTYIVLSTHDGLPMDCTLYSSPQT